MATKFSQSTLGHLPDIKDQDNSCVFNLLTFCVVCVIVLMSLSVYMRILNMSLSGCLNFVKITEAVVDIFLFIM